MAMTYLYLKGSHLAGISIMPINVLHQIIQKMYFSLPKTFMNIQTLDICTQNFRKGFDKKYAFKHVLFLIHLMSKFQEL